MVKSSPSTGNDEPSPLGSSAKINSLENIYLHALESAADAILIIDMNGRIIYTNRQTERLFGYKRDELLGKPVVMLIPERQRQNFLVEQTRYLADPHTRPIGTGQELLASRRDGMEIPVEIALSPMKTGSDRLVTCIVRDIEARKKSERNLQEAYARLEEIIKERTAELQAANEELRERNQELDTFGYSVAHDLKNQLALISGYAEVLRENLHEIRVETQQKYLAAIARNAYKMSMVIESLLLLAGLHKKDATLTILNMQQIIADAYQRLAYQIEESQAEMALPDRWPTAFGYGPWVEEVWVNYIHNAIKYGGTPPCIQLGAEKLSNGMVRFWVKDNGPGLSAEEQHRLFDQFTRLDRNRAGGHGLGLSIVRQIVEKLSGQVGVESQVGEGSKFYFTLPAPPQD